MPVLATLLEKINLVIFSPSRTQPHATEMCVDAKRKWYDWEEGANLKFNVREASLFFFFKATSTPGIELEPTTLRSSRMFHRLNQPVTPKA